MNNRGQSLVLFVLIVPIIVLVILAVYKIGKLALLKESMDNVNNLAIDYVVDHISDDNILLKAEEIINKNMTDLDSVSVVLDDSKVHIKMTKKSDGINITTSYVGYIQDGKKIIEKE